MSYASIAELKGRMKSALDLYSADDGSFDEAQASIDLADAQSLVDGYVGVRYAVPVLAPEAQGLLKSLTLSLAEELAWSRSAHGELPEYVKSRIDRAYSQLKDISSGKMNVANAAELKSSPGGSADVSMARPAFKREQMGGW